jgi:aminoglycoside phosphotransferase (APT) family kinase protein
MHADEVRATEAQVRRLLTEQMPQWADLELSQLAAEGTDHVLFRLGDDLLVRMPKIGWAVDQAERDAGWLPRLATHRPVSIPPEIPIEKMRGMRNRVAHQYEFVDAEYVWAALAGRFHEVAAALTEYRTDT